MVLNIMVLACVKSPMTLHTMENVLPESSHDSEKNARKMITVSGEIRSFDFSCSVYRVSRV